jgi:predicted lipase
MRDFPQQLRAFQSLDRDTYSTAKSAAVINSSDGSRNLYEEMKVMSELSALIYTVAYLLDLIGKGGYPDPDAPAPSSWWSSWSSNKPALKQLSKIELVLASECSFDSNGVCDHVKLQHNLPAKNVLEFIQANAEALSQDPEITGDTSSDREVSPRSRLVLAALENVKLYQDANYLWCMDQHFGNTDLVYAVTVNRKLKRITVAFRGSSNSNDWWQNVQVSLATLRTPDLLKENFSFEEEIKVHGGFMRYLLDKEVAEMELSAKQMEDQRPGKYGQILRDLEECYHYTDTNGVKVHDGFHLYVTGHSLGAALSTLLAMKLSCSWILHEKVKNIPKPIINISVASPYVGNQGFVNATQRLEESGRLRHIRVTNEGDVVPVAPPKRFLYNALYEPYRHGGCNVHLTEKSHEIAFGAERTFASQVSWSSAERHSPADYWSRQNRDKEKFQSMTIEGLYKEYKPQKE